MPTHPFYFNMKITCSWGNKAIDRAGRFWAVSPTESRIKKHGNMASHPRANLMVCTQFYMELLHGSTICVILQDLSSSRMFLHDQKFEVLEVAYEVHGRKYRDMSVIYQCIGGYGYNILWRNIDPAKFREKSQKIQRYLATGQQRSNVLQWSQMRYCYSASKKPFLLLGFSSFTIRANLPLVKYYALNTYIFKVVI